RRRALAQPLLAVLVEHGELGLRPAQVNAHAHALEDSNLKAGCTRRPRESGGPFFHGLPLAPERRWFLVGDFHDRSEPGHGQAEAVALARKSGAQGDLLAELVVETQGERGAPDEIVVGQRVSHAPDVAVL